MSTVRTMACSQFLVILLVVISVSGRPVDLDEDVRDSTADMSGSELRDMVGIIRDMDSEGWRYRGNVERHALKGHFHGGQ